MIQSALGYLLALLNPSRFALANELGMGYRRFWLSRGRLDAMALAVAQTSPDVSRYAA